MRSMLAFPLLLTGILAGAAVPAGAAEAPADPQPDPMERICNAFGPGYRLVPGTTTCIKISGFVRGSITFTDKPRGGDFVPGSAADSLPPKPR